MVSYHDGWLGLSLLTTACFLHVSSRRYGFGQHDVTVAHPETLNAFFGTNHGQLICLVETNIAGDIRSTITNDRPLSAVHDFVKMSTNLKPI